jgi:amino acid transporter
VWLSAVGAILLGLLAFAGPSAINAIFSLAVACQYVVYSIPISARFLGGKEFKRGPFHLGVFVNSPFLPITYATQLIFSFLLESAGCGNRRGLDDRCVDVPCLAHRRLGIYELMCGSRRYTLVCGGLLLHSQSGRKILV